MSPAVLLLSLLTTSTPIPQPAGMEAALVREAGSGKLQKLSLLDAALIAGGTPDALLDERRTKVLAVLRPVIERARRKKTAHARGQALLQELHHQVFRRYETNQTNVWEVIQTGQFNCVSSAVLYVIAAESLLENPRAMLMPTHAFARVTVDGKTVDVETTSENGFDPDPAKLTSGNFVRSLGIKKSLDGKPVDFISERKKAVELPTLALVSTVYSNRAVDLIEHGDRTSALVALDRATRIAPAALKPQLASWRATLLVNMAATLIEEQRALDAIPLLELGYDGADAKTRQAITTNLSIAHDHLAATRVKAGALHEALADLDKALAVDPTNTTAEQRRAQVIAAIAAREGTTKRCEGMTGPSAAQCFSGVSDAQMKAADLDAAVASARRAIASSSTHINARIAMWNALGSRGAMSARNGDCRAATEDYTEAWAYRDVEPNTAQTLNEKIGMCWGALGVKLNKEGKLDPALEAMARAVVMTPGDKNLRYNLAAMQFNKALGLSEKGRCDEARPLVVKAAQNDASVGKDGPSLLASCAYNRALTHWQKQDWNTAAIELRRGLKDAPQNAQLRDNLGRALYNVAVMRQEAGDCVEALGLVDEAVALGLSMDVSALREACR